MHGVLKIQVRFQEWVLWTKTAKEYITAVRRREMTENEALENLVALAMGMLELNVK